MAIGAIGFNPATAPIYRALGYHVGELDHYVAVNHTVRHIELATLAAPEITQDNTLPPLVHRALTRAGLDDIAGLDSSIAPAGAPRKTAKYFSARYLNHPVYSYIVLGLIDPIADNRPVVGLMAARLAEHAGRRALRIVDFIGSAGIFARVHDVVQTLLVDHDAEYADVYNAGVDSATFERAGFVRVDPDGATIVPDHFEPFEHRNVRLRVAIKGAARPILFKGDADQDRPNIVEAARS